MKKRIISAVLILAMALSAYTTAFAANGPDASEYNAAGNILWAFSGDTLYFKGDEEIPDYVGKVYASDFSAPWFSYYEAAQSVDIENGITSIGNAAFFLFRNLTSVNIPASVTRIGSEAFVECVSLRSLTLPGKLSEIGSSAFFNCNSLESITLPKSLKSVGGYAFADCTSLTDVYYEGTEAQWKAISITADGNDALLNATIHFEAKQPVTFSDVPASAWYRDTVYAAAEAGIVTGNEDGTFAPNGELTWAQTVTFAVRLYQYKNGEHVYTAADHVSSNPWYQLYADYALSHGIVEGIPLYEDANAPVTRGKAAEIFAAVLGDAAEVNNIPEGYFPDVPESISHDAVYALARAGIVNGKLDTATGAITYGYEDTFLRSEVATIVARLAGLVAPAKIAA